MSQMNPWLAILTQPRATISAVTAENPKRGLWALAWIYGFLSLLNCFQSLSLGATMSLFPILLLAFVFAPIWGMVVFGIWSWVVYWICKLLGGEGTFSYVRAAYAWSCVPLILSIFLWIFLLFVFGTSLFQNFPESDPMKNGHIVILFGVLVAKVIVAIWSLLIFINALAEVQRFSIARSILSIVLSWVAIGIVIGLIWWGVSSLSLAEITHSKALFQLWQLEALRM